MRKINNISLIIILCAVYGLLATGCEKSTPEHRMIDIGNLRKAEIDTGERYTSVQILKSYPIKVKCEGYNRYASLYICKKRLTMPDTLYVFDECEVPPDFAIDTSIDVETGFFRRDILNTNPKQVNVFMPKDIRIPANAKYLFVRLKQIDN